MTWLDTALHRALVESVLAGALAGLIGVQVVLRRLAFFTMAMTHATFPGVVLAALLGVNLYLGGAVFGAVVAVAVAALSRRRGQDSTSATGVVLAAGFALGVVLLSAQAGFTRDLSAYLVGSVLTVSRGDILTTAIVGVLVSAVLLMVGKELLLGAFDPEGLRASGYPGGALDLLVLLLVEVVIVTTVPAVGTILSVALIVAPAAAARLWTDRIAATTAAAAAIGAACGAGGLWISANVNVSAGGAITLVAAAVFVLSWLVGRHGLLTARMASTRGTSQMARGPESHQGKLLPDR